MTKKENFIVYSFSELVERLFEKEQQYNEENFQ